MRNTKIEWCDATLNPVIGCRHGCPYCYARSMNKRFGFIPNWEEPQFFPERLKQLKTAYPKSVFMDSMSDLAFWQDEWIAKTFEAISRNPKNSYLFLSKDPAAIRRFIIFKSLTRRIEDCVFFGITITNNSDLNKLDECEVDFVSIEPILAPIDISCFANHPEIKQIILGAETGNRINKVIPDKQWINKIVEVADKLNIKVFMKNSLKEIMGEDFRQNQLIWSK